MFILKTTNSNLSDIPASIPELVSATWYRVGLQSYQAKLADFRAPRGRDGLLLSSLASISFPIPSLCASTRRAVMAVDSGNEVLKEEDKSVSSPPVPKPIKNREDEIREVARKFTAQPLQNSDTGVWGILTAISKLSRKRPQVTPFFFFSVHT